VRRLLGQIKSIWRINELLNWQVAASGETIAVADAAATKVFSTERIQEVGRLAEEIVGYGNPADPHTGEVLVWLDKHDQAQPGHHLRRRRQRGDARDDRGLGPRRAEGAPMSGVERQDLAAGIEAIKAAGRSARGWAATRSTSR
jgi:hypothetical protein